jgi:D-glycero-alpha-D-manno-heptose 1-phosphate guanylyltransferase
VKALILAGGAGTRLGERTRELPKPMLPVGGRPFLEYLLDRLLAGGVTEIILSVHYRADAIMRHFGASYRGAALRYAVEPQALGTGGAIAYALREESAAPVLVANGDSYLAIDYGAFLRWHERDPARLALVVRQVEDCARYGAVSVADGTVIGFTDKGARGPGFISAGTYILHSNVFDEFGLSGRFSLETELLHRHCAELRPRAYCFDGYFIDIGVADDLDRAQNELPALLR